MTGLQEKKNLRRGGKVRKKGTISRICGKKGGNVLRRQVGGGAPGGGRGARRDGGKAHHK